MAAVTAVATTAAASTGRRRMKGDLSAVFGVELDDATPAIVPAGAPAAASSRKRKAPAQAVNGKAKIGKRQPVKADILAPKVQRTSKQKAASSSAASVARTRRVSARTPAPSRKAAAAAPASPAAKKRKPAATSQVLIPKKLTGATIRKLRARLKLSAAEFGERLGVSGQTIYNWEKKKGVLKLRESSIARLRELF